MPDKQMQLVVIQDRHGADTNFVECVQWDGDTFPSESFVILEDSITEQEFLAQIVGPQLNINNSGIPDGAATINQVREVVKGRYKRDVVIEDLRVFKLSLLGTINGQLMSVSVRPTTTSVGRLATAEEVCKWIGLPQHSKDTAIGHLRGVDVSLCLSSTVMTHHMLIAGSTGSGKTNTVANAIYVSACKGACVIVFDHKPDYQDCHKSVDGSETLNVDRFTVGDSGESNPVQVEACDLDIPSLASSMFHFGENKPEEQFVECMEKYADEQGKKKWTYDKFLKWVSAKSHTEFNAHKATWDAMIRKIKPSRHRVPSWVNTGSGFLGRSNFDAEDKVTSGKVITFDVSRCNGRDYGLFMNYILKSIADNKSVNKLNVPILCVVDEAQDIFDSPKSVAGRAVLQFVRKGRSQKTCFVFACQSADNLPDDLRNNLNSQILHRHLNVEQAKAAVSVLSSQQVAKLRTLAPGEALVYFFGAQSVVHAQLKRSPFELTIPSVDWEW